MQSLAARMRADTRLAILQILAKDLHFSQNHEILRTAVDTATAISLTEADIKEHLAWLENQELVSTEIVGRYVTAKLTGKGLKVGGGEEIAEGVSRPSPDDI